MNAAQKQAANKAAAKAASYLRSALGADGEALAAVEYELGRIKLHDKPAESPDDSAEVSVED